MELLLDFLNLLTRDEYFRSGFVSALVLVALVWLAWTLLFRIYVHWLKMRQFFEPIKKPGKIPTEVGPSPAGMLVGCLLRITVALFVIGLGVFLWLGLTPRG